MFVNFNKNASDPSYSFKSFYPQNRNINPIEIEKRKYIHVTFPNGQENLINLNVCNLSWEVANMKSEIII